ncbi:MAG: hypothetical protein B9S32_06990 [Verrucomicrobia bacterium Tous-C9LFEB]|nr:MAG: hypothetical protein B9S32_06990 [Verrucomicrobia bacterium Tous-C9LFEB]
MKTWLLGAAFLVLLNGALFAEAPATRNCRLLMDPASGEILLREGPCDVRRSPCSTFKVPLALMGFDAGVLKDAHHPEWDYLPEYPSNRPEEQIRINPTSWEAISVVWYSQKLTRALGMKTFQKYVDQFQYGNRDLSGAPGQNNGLTNAWLQTSLLISPDEQAVFVRKLLQRKLGVSSHAYEMTEAVLPQFPAEDGWTLTGKTGTGFQEKADGTPDRKKQLGWFIGWATKGDRRVLFVEFIMDETPQETYAGPRARAALIKALPGLLAKKR